MLKTLLTSVLTLLAVQRSQQQLSPLTNTWNSTFRLTDAQIAAANLTDEVAHDLELAIQREQTNNAGPLTQNDPFYYLPDDYDASDPPPPGTVLKVEEYTNITLYTLPMSLSMSRFLYMTETLNGSSQPASAYVLWPYIARTFAGVEACSPQEHDNTPVYPLIGLAHGTSGFNQACAPSGLRSLWGDWSTSFPLALAGYAIVAPDYLGYGVANITAPYFVAPSQANDLFRAIEAAQHAWPRSLSKQFLLAGQSQGGLVSWAAAHRQAVRPMEGYLGTMAASPFPDVFAAIASESEAQVNGRVLAIAQGMSTVYPGFELSDWLTDAGIARLDLMKEIQACGDASGTLFGSEVGEVQILKDGWNSTESALWYQDIASMSGRPIASPMMVIQGTEDGNAYEPSVTASVKETCGMNPGTQLEYISMENITHVPVLYAGQHTFMDWIRDRFTGVSAAAGCTLKKWSPSRGYASADFDGFKIQTWELQYTYD